MKTKHGSSAHINCYKVLKSTKYEITEHNKAIRVDNQDAVVTDSPFY